MPRSEERSAVYRMTSEENAERYLTEWLDEHDSHEHSVKSPPDGYSICAQCFDCGHEYALTITITNDAFREARGVLKRDGAVTF
jgi:hypothetical protein